MLARENAESEKKMNLKNFIGDLEINERQVLKSMLSSKVDSFFDGSNLTNFKDQFHQDQFNELAESLRLLTPFHQEMPKNGISYVGRPEWLTPELITSLQSEALDRKEKPLDRIDHFLGCGGTIADRLSTDPEINKFISQQAGPIRPTGIASYIYYTKEGSGIRPHVDTEVFSLNLIIMLKHSAGLNEKKSSTSVFPANEKAEHYWLDIGEALLMYGSGTIHGRTKINAGEEVHILTIGFNRISSSLGNNHV